MDDAMCVPDIIHTAIVIEAITVPAKIAVILSIYCLCGSLYAECDLNQFRWDCEFRAHRTLHSDTRRLVYCGNTAVYVRTADYLRLIQNEKAHIQMNLTVNGEQVESPCIPQ